MKRFALFCLICLGLSFTTEVYAQKHPKHPRKVRVVKKHRHHCKHPNCVIVGRHRH